MNVGAGEPQSPSDGSSSERSEVGWVSNGSPTAPTPTQNGMMSSASRDWLSFLFMTLGKSIPDNTFFFYITDFRRLSGWFVLLSSIIGFWRVKRWERSVRTPVVPPIVEQVEADSSVRRNVEHVLGISFVQPSEDNQSRVHQEESSSSAQARLTRDLRAAGLL